MFIVNRYILFMGLLGLYFAPSASAQTTVSFNFSAASHPVSGWINVAGDPSTGVRTGTDPSTGITVSSVATANWVGYKGVAACDGLGAAGGAFFPAAVMQNMWYQYSAYFGGYNAVVPQLVISGLNKDSVYTLKMTGSIDVKVRNFFNLNPTRYSVAGSAVYGFVDVNGNFNTNGGATFLNIAPDASGNIRVYVNTLSSTNAAGISGIEIIRGRTPAPVSGVSMLGRSRDVTFTWC